VTVPDAVPSNEPADMHLQQGGAQSVGSPAVGPPAVGPPAVGPPSVGSPAVGSPAVGSPAVGPPAVGPPAVGPPVVGSAAAQYDGQREVLGEACAFGDVACEMRHAHWWVLWAGMLCVCFSVCD